MRSDRAWTATPALLCLVLLSFPVCASPARAEILVHDAVAVRGKETTLTAETRGTFLSRGGEPVEFFLGKVSLGKALSGGDGFAYKHFTPRGSGLQRFVVKSAREEGAGLLLTLDRGKGIVFVDFENALVEDPLTGRPRPESRKALASVSRKFPVVLLQPDAFGLNATRLWLREHGFEALPVLPWRQGGLFDDLVGMGLKIRAIVGGRPVIESARRHGAQLFSFDDVDNAQGVKDWNEIARALGATR